MKMLTLIGPMLSKRRGDKPSGRPVAFMDLLSHLDRLCIDYEAVDANRFNHVPVFGRPLSAAWVMSRASRYASQGHVSFHGAGPGIAAIGGRLIKASARSGATVSLRVFGGRFDTYFKGASLTEQRRVRHVFSRASAVFLETKYQVNFFQGMASNVFWFPNSRNAGSISVDPCRPYQRRFVFIGQLRPEKGILEFIEVAERLGTGYTFDAYGPLMNGITEMSFARSTATYRGILGPEQVPSALAQYDALVLPTAYEGEGYPGVIIEALSVGVPTIGSSQGGIPEIIVDGECGLVVVPRSTQSLLEAINRFERLNLSEMRDQAHSRFKLFDSREQYGMFLEKCGIFG